MRGMAVAAFLAAGGGALAAGGTEQKPLGRSSAPSDSPRQYMSCEQTYGRGWETCGGQSSRLCYSPALGQSCCEVDNSYCAEGTWCAPVPGFCCLDSEDLETCAKTAGFKIPDLAGTITRTSPSPTPKPPATSSDFPWNAASSPAWERADLMVPGARYVQVSMARKEQWTLTWAGLGIGVVGLLVLSC